MCCRLRLPAGQGRVWQTVKARAQVVPDNQNIFAPKAHSAAHSLPTSDFLQSCSQWRWQNLKKSFSKLHYRFRRYTSLIKFSLSLNSCKVMMIFFKIWPENIKKAAKIMQLLATFEQRQTSERRGALCWKVLSMQGFSGGISALQWSCRGSAAESAPYSDPFPSKMFHATIGRAWPLCVRQEFRLAASFLHRIQSITVTAEFSSSFCFQLWLKRGPSP